MLLSVGLCRQSIHKIFQLSAILRGQLRFERVRQSAPHSTHPTIALVVQISTPSRQLTGWVYSHAANHADDPHHLSFRQNFTASHAGSLGNMFYALGRFPSHLQITRRFIPSHFQFHRRRACVSCGQRLPPSLRQIPIQWLSSCPSCLSSYHWFPLLQVQCFGRFRASS